MNGSLNRTPAFTHHDLAVGSSVAPEGALQKVHYKLEHLETLINRVGANVIAVDLAVRGPVPLAADKPHPAPSAANGIQGILDFIDRITHQAHNVSNFCQDTRDYLAV